MSAKLKVGQTVEVIDASPMGSRKFPFAKGSPQIVERVDARGALIKVVGRNGWFRAHRFEVRGG